MELNADQIRIVESKPNGHVLIKGVAGSGKTTVAVSKIPILINHYMQQNDEILLVTYNKTLIEYTKHLMNYTNIKEEIFFTEDINKKLNIRTIDSIITYYGSKISPAFSVASNIQMRDMMRKAIGHVKRRYEKIELISEKYYAFLNEEIDWIKSCGYVERETYLNVDRIGRMSRGENRYRLLKNSEERKAIFEIYLYYEKLMEQGKLVDYKTNALLVLQAIREGRLRLKKYRHVIVDESQDLTRIQLEIIKYLYQKEIENSCIMFIADVAQSIYTQSWLSCQSFKSIGFDMSGRSNILSKNYRTTYEIAQAAYSLIENDDAIKQNDNFVKPIALERHGKEPFYKHYTDSVQEAEGISRRIKQLVKRYPLKDIVVVAANKGCLENLKDILLKRGIPTEIFSKAEPNFDKDVVRLFTIHSVKGLEFPVLFIACINEGVLPYSEEDVSVGRRLLYVGMTRAKQELYLSSSKKESMFIRELDMSLLCSDDTEFTSFYKVDVSDYLFKDKLTAIYSREEMVRQWFINELIVKKQYPKENLEIEYLVQKGSQRGFVDIVVFKNINAQNIPYIFIEIKQYGEDMESALKQVKTYASCCPCVEYVVATDGKDMFAERIRDGQYESVECIPIYSRQEQNVYDRYDYVSFGSNKQYIYAINCEDREEIIIQQKDSKEVLAYDGYRTVNMIGKVAAGVLKFANQEEMGSYRIPNLFLRGITEAFMLEVCGDSMIHFGIFDGDIVLMKRQAYAGNGDIVVAGQRGSNEVTLKQYCNFNGIVGLMPGNPKYEPCMIPEEEVFVNGVLLGVLHHKN